MTISYNNVQIEPLATTVNSGSTERRLVSIYLDISNSSSSDTIALTTYVPNLSGVAGLEYDCSATGVQSQESYNASWSGTTVTLNAARAQSIKLIGYYT